MPAGGDVAPAGPVGGALAAPGVAVAPPVSAIAPPVSAVAPPVSTIVTSPTGPAAAATTGSVLPSAVTSPLSLPLTSHVAAANHDGSFDHADTPVLGIYIVTATGDVSGRTYSQQQVDLRTPTIATTQTTAGQSSCRAVGLPVGN